MMVLQFSYGVVSQGSQALGVLTSLSHPISTARRHNNVPIPAFLNAVDLLPSRGFLFARSLGSRLTRFRCVRTFTHSQHFGIGSRGSRSFSWLWFVLATVASHRPHPFSWVSHDLQAVAIFTGLAGFRRPVSAFLCWSGVAILVCGVLAGLMHSRSSRILSHVLASFARSTCRHTSVALLRRFPLRRGNPQLSETTGVPWYQGLGGHRMQWIGWK
jgi:hypothetical protein